MVIMASKRSREGMTTPTPAPPSSKRVKKDSENAINKKASQSPRKNLWGSLAWLNQPISHLPSTEKIPWLPEKIVKLFEGVQVVTNTSRLTYRMMTNFALPRPFSG
jgi:hypothetical protein